MSRASLTHHSVSLFEISEQKVSTMSVVHSLSNTAGGGQKNWQGVSDKTSLEHPSFLLISRLTMARESNNHHDILKFAFEEEFRQKKAWVVESKEGFEIVHRLQGASFVTTVSTVSKGPKQWVT